MQLTRLGTFILFSMFLLTGCDKAAPPPAPSNPTTLPADHSHAEAAAEPPHHEHKPPHGGTLVELGEEFSHLELILDAKEGRLTGYALDGEAEKAVRLKQPEIVIRISKVTHDRGGEQDVNPPATVSLKAVANALSAETVGDTSEFTAQSDLLKGATHFQGVLEAITIKGEEFKNVSFAFPEGNDEHAK